MKLFVILTAVLLGVFGSPVAALRGDETTIQGQWTLQGRWRKLPGSHRKLLDLSTPEDVTLAKSLFARWNAALATGDPEKVTALYSPGAILLPTLSNIPRNNHSLIADYFFNFLKKKPSGSINRSFVSRPSYNVLLDSGIYTFALTDPTDGAKSTVQARYTFVYELIDGQWYIKEHHSSGMPEQQQPSNEDVTHLFDTWNAALATLDPKKVAALYTKDAVLLPTLSNKVRTTPAEIEDYFVSFLKKNPKGQIDTSELSVLSPTLATRAGLYTFFTNVDGVEGKVQARYSFLYRKVGDKWLIAQHHSSAMPEQPLPTEAEIHQLFVDWNAALQTKDPEKVVDLYATGNNSVLLPTLSNMVADTKDEKIQYFKGFLAKSPVGEINEEHIQVLSPTLAANSGIYSFTLTTDGKTSKVQARYTFVYSKASGQWKIIDHHSSLMPESK